MSVQSSSTKDDHRLHTKDYLTSFNTDGYLSIYFFFELIPAFNGLLKELVSVFVKNKHRLGYGIALEFGGGPTLFPSFLLAQCVESIHFTDYTPGNLKAVKDWINREECAYDWTRLFKAILHEYQEQVFAFGFSFTLNYALSCFIVWFS